ncbi:MAG: hypothetical protein GON13_04065 [Nanoarchaeota archaeon]|nr:hypothetical protein [Nanoarchaeota archaeon]
MRWLFLLLLLPSLVFAWEDCPFGLVNDTYPGECGRYVDTNDDSICDHSQVEPLIQNDALLIQGSAVNVFSINEKYPFIIITVLLSIAYFISLKIKMVSLPVKRKFWNVLLLVTFLVSAGLGVLLVLNINFGWGWYVGDLLFWHVNFGIAMTIISIFHVLWHRNYYFQMIKSIL